MQIKTIAVSACMSLFGCATPQNYNPVTKQISFPSIGMETNAPVGDNLLVQGEATSTKGIYLREPNNIVNRKFSAGFYPQTGEDKDYTYHSFQIGQSRGDMGASIGNSAIDVESLRAGKSKRQICLMLAMRALAFGLKPCDTEHEFSREERFLIGTKNFQQSLIYSGRIGNRVRIGYREFSGDIARPAFSNEVEYDLSQSDIVTYKGAKIRIIDANNEGIKYIVLSNFNTTVR